MAIKTKNGIGDNNVFSMHRIQFISVINFERRTLLTLRLLTVRTQFIDDQVQG